MNQNSGIPARYISEIKNIPWEASLLFMGWIWLGWSVFGMTLVNMLLSEPLKSIINIYHLVVGAVYLFPAALIIFKTIKNRNVAGLPLIICAFVIGYMAIVSHSKLNLGLEVDLSFLKGFVVILLTLILVAMPLSFYVYALSIGCENTRNLKIILLVCIINALLLVYNQLIGRYGVDSQLIASLMISFLLVTGPISGGSYIKEVLSKDPKDPD